MMVMTNTSLVGVLAAGYSREHLEAILRQLTELADTGAVRPTIAERVSFEDIPDALTRLAARKVLGKFVVEIEGVKGN
jgi:NADPH2:quinone reductase